MNAVQWIRHKLMATSISTQVLGTINYFSHNIAGPSQKKKKNLGSLLARLKGLSVTHAKTSTSIMLKESQNSRCKT